MTPMCRQPAELQIQAAGHAGCGGERETELLRLLEKERRRADQIQAQVALLQRRRTKVRESVTNSRAKLQAKQLIRRRSEQATDLDEAGSTTSRAGLPGTGDCQRGRQEGA